MFSVQKVSRMKSKNNMKKGLYEILDWLEREKPMRIKDFWRCVLKETIMNQYPALRLMRNSLMDGKRVFSMMLMTVILLILHVGCPWCIFYFCSYLRTLV